jgi:hypothetical protein
MGRASPANFCVQLAMIYLGNFYGENMMENLDTHAPDSKK